MVWYSGADMGGATVCSEYATIGRVYICLCKTDLQRCKGVSLSFGSAHATLIKRILASGWVMVGHIEKRMIQGRFSGATVGLNRVGFILRVRLRVELIAGDLNFKMALQNETSNCFIAKDCITGKEYVSHIEEL